MSLITMRSGRSGTEGAALSGFSEEPPARWLLGNPYYNVPKTKMKTHRNLSTAARVCDLSPRGYWNRRTAMSLRPLRTTFWVPGHGLYIKNTSKINKQSCIWKQGENAQGGCLRRWGRMKPEGRISRLPVLFGPYWLGLYCVPPILSIPGIGYWRRGQ